MTANKSEINTDPYVFLIKSNGGFVKKKHLKAVLQIDRTQLRAMVIKLGQKYPDFKQQYEYFPIQKNDIPVPIVRQLIEYVYPECKYCIYIDGNEPKINEDNQITNSIFDFTIKMYNGKVTRDQLRKTLNLRPEQYQTLIDFVAFYEPDLKDELLSQKKGSPYISYSIAIQVIKTIFPSAKITPKLLTY